MVDAVPSAAIELYEVVKNSERKIAARSLRLNMGRHAPIVGVRISSIAGPVVDPARETPSAAGAVFPL